MDAQLDASELEDTGGDAGNAPSSELDERAGLLSLPFAVALPANDGCALPTGLAQDRCGGATENSCPRIRTADPRD